NCAQHQRDIAMAIKLGRELALLPYATRVTSSRGGGRGGGRGRDDRGPREERGPRPEGTPGGPQVGDTALPGAIPEEPTTFASLADLPSSVDAAPADAVEAEA